MIRLISTAKFPIRVKYDGQIIVVSPGERLKLKNEELLPGKLPDGLVVQKIGA
jgi:hypothetical protein